MGVANSGNNVIVDSAGVTLAGFTTAAASNIKVVDNKYDITSGAIGSAANGQLNLQKASGAVALLAGTETITCQSAQVSAGLSTDAPVANMYLDVSGVKLVITANSGFSETVAPIVGNVQTQVVYRASGTTYNSIHPGLNINGSTLIFEAGGDGHLGTHPNAIVKNPILLFRSTSPSDFLLALNPAWATSNKPSPLDGLRFVSIRGNNRISLFGWPSQTVPSGFFNNAFHVCKDFTYDVALPNTRPTQLLQSYRRAAFNAAAGSYFGSGNINLTHLFIDLKTTLSSGGVLDSSPTYLRNTQYVLGGASDTGDSIFAVRFTPTMQRADGTKLSNVSVVVLNENTGTAFTNVIGERNAKLAASGITDATGQMVITEPTTKNYTSNASHRTDSIVVRNRTRTAAWHKWWEAGTKLILITDTRGTTGNVTVTGFPSTGYLASYRQAGSLFTSMALDTSAPSAPFVSLAIDTNYNSSVATTGLTVSYVGTQTTLTIASGSYTLDQLYKAIIDFHANADRNEIVSTLPIVQNNNGKLEFGANLTLVANNTVNISAGDNVTELSTTQNLTFNDGINANVTAVYTTSAGTSTSLQITTPSNGYSLAIYNGSGVTKYFGQNLVAGTYTIYFTPAEAGSYTFAAENYGFKRVQEPLNISGGIIGTTLNDQEDVGITDTKANVAAYTLLSTTEMLYDATAYFRLSETGIKLGQLVARDGLYLDYGTNNVKINDIAASVVSYASGTITYKALVINASTKYDAMKATPPASITVTDNELINVLIEDANGDSQLTILGGDNIGYELWKVTTSTPTDDYATGTLLTTLTTNTAPYRFIGLLGFDIVGRDISSGVRRRSSMSKGVYSQAFYVGDQIQLASNAPQLVENNEKLDELIVKMDTNMDVAISTRLAAADYVEPDNATILSIDTKVQALENYNDAILQGKADAIQAKVDTLNNYNDTITQTKLDNLATDLDTVALESTAQAIKAKTDTLENYNDATAQAKLDAIKAKTDTLVNTDLTGIALESTSQSILTAIVNLPSPDLSAIEADLTVINENVKDASLLIPATRNL